MDQINTYKFKLNQVWNLNNEKHKERDKLAEIYSDN